MEFTSIYNFMKDYADSFWACTEFAFEIYSVFAAWFISIFSLIAICIIFIWLSLMFLEWLKEVLHG